MIGLTGQLPSNSIDMMTSSPSRLFTLQSPLLQDLSVFIVVCRFDRSLVSDCAEEFRICWLCQLQPPRHEDPRSVPRSLVRFFPSCPSPQSRFVSWKTKVFLALSLGTCTSYSSGIPLVSYFLRLLGLAPIADDSPACASVSAASASVSAGKRR